MRLHRIGACRHRRDTVCCHLAISLFILLISSIPRMGLVQAQVRQVLQAVDSTKAVIEDNKSILRAQIGSRPPRCERRCHSCGHCEAIQVPTNPKTRRSSTVIPVIAYARGEDSSNYKPMSWKCKCGDLIFNP